MSPTPRSAVAAGRRDRLVQLVAVTQSTGGSGFPVETDQPADESIEVWASIEPLGGRERIQMNQVSAPFDTRWVLPYGTAWDPDIVDVPKTFALMHKGRRYDIVAAAIIGREEGVELLTLARNG
jgi:hypothetical protein